MFVLLRLFDDDTTQDEIYGPFPTQATAEQFMGTFDDGTECIVLPLIVPDHIKISQAN